MPFTARVNESLRFTAQDLTHSDSGAVTSGATVTVTILDAAGATVSTDDVTVPGSGDDWWVDLDAPATAGIYTITITAVLGAATWATADTLTVIGLTTILGYTTVGVVRPRLGITGTAQDDAIASVIEAASREIDGLCSRFFYRLTATRYYSPDAFGALDIDDLVSVTTLKSDPDGDETFDTTWATTDYRLGPRNAADAFRPYTNVTIKANGLYSFPVSADGVQIVGTWGWPVVPTAISEATVLQAVRLFKRAASPYGIAGSAELGMQSFMPPRVDPQVASLVAPYRKLSPVGAI